MIRSTEQIARQTIDGLTDDILGYINPANDNMLAAWQMALERGKQIVMAPETTCKAIAARPLVTGNDALRAIADEPPFSEEPFAEQIAQTIAARRIAVATPEEDEALDEKEAQQIERAHPEVFDLQDYVARTLGIGKVG